MRRHSRHSRHSRHHSSVRVSVKVFFHGAGRGRRTEKEGHVGPGGPGARPSTHLVLPSLEPPLEPPGYVVAGDPRWQGTREQEKRGRLAKKFYVAFRRGEDDETRYAGLAKMPSATHREETPRAGLLPSNGQSNEWDDLVEEGLISAKDAGRKHRTLLAWFEEGKVPEGGRGEIEIQILEDHC